MSARIIPFSKRAPIVPPAIQEPPEEIDLSDHLFGDLGNPYVVKVTFTNDSIGCSEGDALIVDCALTPRAGDLVVFDEDGEYILRRFASVPLKLATGARPEEPTISKVFGVVVHHLRTLRGIRQPKGAA
jgi:SOS-response transcriptional repressor LexA